MLKCEHCGELFSEPGTYEEYRGEFWGMPAYETMACCPYCGSDEFYEYEEEDEEEE